MDGDNRVLLRCRSCGAVNRVKREKIHSGPVCGKCGRGLAILSAPVNVTRDNYKSEIRRSPGPVLLVFWSPTCGHCRRLLPVLDVIAREKAGILKVARVNTHEEHHLPLQFDIRGVPTLILFKNGKKTDILPGAVPEQQLQSWLYSHGVW